jgi:cytochrome c551/c552
MNKLFAIMPGMLVAVAATLFLPPVFAETPGYLLKAGMMTGGMMGGGMMGGGMMGGEMMGQSSGNDESGQASVNPRRADALLAYMRKNSLTCTSCHRVSGSGVGPSFAAISASYAGRDDAEGTLQDHIENGFRRMPGGMANRSQAAILVKMIVDLTKSQ